MFANAKALLVLAACALAALAQSSVPTTTDSAPASQSSLPAGLDACILDCVTTAAASGGCASYTDLPCVCTSTAFQSAALACLQANCTADDLTAAEQLQAEECASITPATTTSVAQTTASSAATTAPSSAAMALSVPFAFESLFGTLLATAGALVGAALVL